MLTVFFSQKTHKTAAFIFKLLLLPFLFWYSVVNHIDVLNFIQQRKGPDVDSDHHLTVFNFIS